MIIIDLRTSHHTPNTVPDDALVPLAQAHTLTPVSKPTVYRWRKRGLLDAYTRDADPNYTMYVRAGDVRTLARRIESDRMKSHAPVRT